MIVTYDDLIKAIIDSCKRGGDDMDIMNRVSYKFNVSITRIKPILLHIQKKRG